MTVWNDPMALRPLLPRVRSRDLAASCIGSMILATLVAVVWLALALAVAAG